MRTTNPLFVCSVCDGLHGDMTAAEASLIIGLGRKMQADSDEPRYFDVTVSTPERSRRVHGWYDEDSRRVVQYG